MSTDQNKALVRRCIDEVWNRADSGAFDALLSPSIIRHGPPPTEGDIRGLDGFRQLVAMYRAAYPDLIVSIDNQVAEGDQVASRWTARGTHGGELMGMAPTGRSLSIVGVIVDRIEGGKIAEEWASYDALGMLQQLGALPAPA